MSLLVESSVLAEVTSSVFKAMTGLDVRPGGDASEFQPIVAMVCLSADEDRMVVFLRLGEELALQAAGAMLGDKAIRWGPDAEDALGELANVIAGNLKPHLRAGLILSLPTVVRGSNFRIRIPHLSISQSETFSCPEEPLVVMLGREG